jgi:putative sugar O-methyltransferase
MTAVVENYEVLLKTLIQDAKEAKSPWTITPYWSTYHNRLLQTLSRDGVGTLQNNYHLLKGFALGGTPSPIPPAGKIKGKIFNVIPKLPIISKVFNEYNRIINALHISNIKEKIKLGELMLDSIAECYPKITIPGEIHVGDARDAFEWRGQTFTTSFIPHLARVADFYQVVDPQQVTSLLEVGPGLGLSTLAHLTLNPHLCTVINVDIPSTLYISTQFLRAVNACDIVDYCLFKENGFQFNHSSKKRPLCYQIPPWCMERIDIPIDWFHNAFSFQEMEPHVVKAYAQQVSMVVKKGAWLMSNPDGHVADAGGQKERVTFEIIEDAFNTHFKRDVYDMANFSASDHINNKNSRLYSYI